MNWRSIGNAPGLNGPADDDGPDLIAWLDDQDDADVADWFCDITDGIDEAICDDVPAMAALFRANYAAGDRDTDRKVGREYTSYVDGLNDY